MKVNLICQCEFRGLINSVKAYKLSQSIIINHFNYKNRLDWKITTNCLHIFLVGTNEANISIIVPRLYYGVIMGVVVS